MSVDPKAPTDDYIGEPDYPGPYATKRPLEGLRDTDEARIVCLAPDVCLKQVGSSVVPVPFQIHDLCGHDENYTPSVRFTGQKAMVMRSRTSHCHGDAEGDRLGIVSGTIEDVSEPITNAGRVRAEGSEVITHLDTFKMNNGNTVGEAQFVRGTRTYEPPEDDDPVPGSLRLAEGSLDDAFGEPIVLAYAGDPADFVRSGEGTTTAPERRTQTGNPARGAILRRLGYLGLAIELVFFGDDVKRRDNIRQFERLAANPTYSDEAQAIFGEIARDLRRTTGWDDMREVIDRGLARAEQLERDGRFRRSEQEPEEDPKPVPPPPVGDSVRVNKNDDGECIVGPYDDIVDICNPRGGKTHHVIPDMVYRLYDRASKHGTERTPNSPTLGEGESICLTGAQHARKKGSEGVHEYLLRNYKGLDVGFHPGTAPMGRVLLASQNALRAVPGIPPECVELANQNAANQVAKKTGVAAPGRIREARPNAEGRAVLRAGRY